MHVALLIDDFLSLTHLESGNFKVMFENCSVIEGVVEPAWRLMLTHSKLSEKMSELQLVKTIGEGIPEAVVADPARLIQARRRRPVPCRPASHLC